MLAIAANPHRIKAAHRRRRRVSSVRFPGQYFDAETGLNYNYFRDYEPGTGRYIESDPLGLPGGLNTYGYAGANTLRYMDPVGLTCMTNWDFFWDWWFERGSTSRKYGDGDTENQEMQHKKGSDPVNRRFPTARRDKT